jgi:hypothetical protein
VSKVLYRPLSFIPVPSGRLLQQVDVEVAELTLVIARPGSPVEKYHGYCSKETGRARPEASPVDL